MYYVTAALLRTIYFVIFDLYSGRDVKSGNRINIVLLTPLKKIKSKVIRILQVQISNLGKE